MNERSRERAQTKIRNRASIFHWREGRIGQGIVEFAIAIPVTASLIKALTFAIARIPRREGSIYDEFDEVNFQSYGINVRRGFVLSSVFPTLNALGGIGTALLTYLGGLNVAEGAVTAGAWYLFIRGLERSWFPVLSTPIPIL